MLSQADPGSGRYRGRRRNAGRSGRRAARLGTAAVVAAVGVVLIGSGVLASYLSAPITLPVVPPSPSPSPSAVPAPLASPPQGTSRLGVAPSPAASPIPLPAAPPPAPPPPATRAPSPTASPPPADPPPLTTVSFEAEAAVLGGDAHVIPLPAASGGEVVVVIGWRARHHVRFPDVTVDNAGEYELTLDYAVAPFLTDQDLSGRVSVNGEPPSAVSFPALPDGQAVSSVSVTIELVAGDNEIRFDGPGGWAPNLDRITVSPLS